MTTNRKNGFIEIKLHWGTKHRILGKYLNACLTFQRKYNNFAYVDTHGGSGKVLLDGKLQDGSPLIAAKEIGKFPCFTTEINEESYSRLLESTSNYPNVRALRGDCNVLLPNVLKQIEKWRFCLCFVDPDGLTYYDKGEKIMQLTWQTIELISSTTAPQTELLLNLPIMPILRVMGFVESLPDEPKTPAMERDIDLFFGCEEWRTKKDRRELLDLFMDERLGAYEYKGAFLVNDSTGHPLYYLVYASHNETGAKIMNGVMLAEYNQLLLSSYPLERFYFD